METTIPGASGLEHSLEIGMSASSSLSSAVAKLLLSNPSAALFRHLMGAKPFFSWVPSLFLTHAAVVTEVVLAPVPVSLVRELWSRFEELPQGPPLSWRD